MTSWPTSVGPLLVWCLRREPTTSELCGTPLGHVLATMRRSSSIWSELARYYPLSHTHTHTLLHSVHFLSSYGSYKEKPGSMMYLFFLVLQRIRMHLHEAQKPLTTRDPSSFLYLSSPFDGVIPHYTRGKRGKRKRQVVLRLRGIIRPNPMHLRSDPRRASFLFFFLLGST